MWTARIIDLPGGQPYDCRGSRSGVWHQATDRVRLASALGFARGWSPVGGVTEDHGIG